MIFIKKLLCFFLAALLFCSVAGCNNAETEASSLPALQDEPPQSSEPSSEPVISSSSDISSGGISFVNPAAQTVAPAVLESPESYYCYSQLTSRQKEIYLIMFSAASAMIEGAFRVGDCEFTDIITAFGALRNDMPQLFWLTGEYLYADTVLGYTVTFQSSDRKVSYLCSDEEKASMSLFLEQKANEIIAKIPQGASEYEKELFIYDYLCENTEYSDSSKNAHSAYGALVEGKAVCEGYSRAMQLLLSLVGTESTLVAGEADSTGHMWNLVKIENVWYHLDATWGDAFADEPVVTHGFFNVDDETISKSHKIDPHYSTLDASELKSGSGWNFTLPKCESLTYFYHNRLGTVLSDDVKASSDIIKQQLLLAAQAKQPQLEFYIDSNEVDIITKYGLNHCLSEVNKNLSQKIKIPSVSYVGNSAVIFIKYEGE